MQLIHYKNPFKNTVVILEIVYIIHSLYISILTNSKY